MWQPIDNVWVPRGTPQACPELLFQAPVDLDLVTSILYPGQFRGNDFKPHGGFRLDGGQGTAVEVRAPMSAWVVDGSRYLEDGIVQHLFDFEHPCGLRYRFDHLLVLSPKLAALAEGLPEPSESDSRTWEVPRTAVEAGELLATEVGVPGNVFVDWGVYDLRQRNAASANPPWPPEREDSQSPYALCWLELLGPDSAKAKALPGSGSSGKQSAYCT